jgi:hypothetical protein
MAAEKDRNKMTPWFIWNFEENHASVKSGWTVFGPSVASQRTNEELQYNVELY